MTRSRSLLATALLAAIACSSNDNNDSDASVDCALVGCAKPPPCGQPCTEPCGCCPNPDCASDATPPLQDSGSTPAPDVDEPDVGSDIGSDIGLDVGGPSDLSVTFNDGGCLDWNSASRTCGFKSDKSVCEQVVKCGFNKEVSQCQIDCEMGSASGNCYSADDVSCLLDAVAKESCEDLKACGWIL